MLEQSLGRRKLHSDSDGSMFHTCDDDEESHASDDVGKHCLVACKAINASNDFVVVMHHHDTQCNKGTKKQDNIEFKKILTRTANWGNWQNWINSPFVY